MIKVRGQSLGKMKPEEVQQFIEWAHDAQKRTTFDSGVIGYPRCAMLITEDGNGPLAYLLCQTVLMAEVFIPRPDSRSSQRAASLGLFDDALQKLGSGMDVGDVYCFVPFTEGDYATKIQRHGWKEIPGVRLFKKSTGVTVNGRG